MTSSAVKARIRLVDGPPRKCLGCACGPDVGISYVEFILPALKGQLVGEGQTFVMDEIDELVLCEVCVRTAALRLGLRRDPRLDAEVQRLSAARDAVSAHVQEASLQQNALRERISMETPR